MTVESGWWLEAVHIGRWTNIVLAVVALVLLFWAVRGWKYRSAGNRFLWIAVGLFSFTAGYGSFEQLRQDGHGGYRIVLTTVCLLYAIAGLWSKGRGGWTEDTSEHGRGGQRP